MDINKVVFGNFSIGTQKGNAKSQEKEQETSINTKTANQTKSLDAEAVFSALNIAGMQNMAKITRFESKEVNPANYLSQDRINDIEAMMGKFEDGVNSIADTIEQELPGFFAADAKNALAAKIFAQE